MTKRRYTPPRRPGPGEVAGFLDSFKPNKKGSEMTSKKVDTNARPEMQEISEAFVKFVDTGETAEGRYAGFSFFDGRDGPVPRYTLANSDGEPVVFLGTTKIIEFMQRVPHEAYVIITYQGEDADIKTPNGTLKTFTFQVEQGIKLLPVSPDKGLSFALPAGMASTEDLPFE